GQMVPTLLPFKEGNYYDPDLLDSVEKLISDFLQDRGYMTAKIKLDSILNQGEIDFVVEISTGQGIDLKTISIESDVEAFKNELDEVFRPLLAGNWNVARARQIAEEFERLYFSKGFWSTEVKASLNGTEELYIH